MSCCCWFSAEPHPETSQFSSGLDYCTEAHGNIKPMITRRNAHIMRSGWELTWCVWAEKLLSPHHPSLRSREKSSSPELGRLRWSAEAPGYYRTTLIESTNDQVSGRQRIKIWSPTSAPLQNNDSINGIEWKDSIWIQMLDVNFASSYLSSKIRALRHVYTNDDNYKHKNV